MPVGDGPTRNCESDVDVRLSRLFVFSSAGACCMFVLKGERCGERCGVSVGVTESFRASTLPDRGFGDQSL